jgi:hypothetical protein
VDWSPLLGRRPIIVPDNTIPGVAKAARLEVYLRSLGIQASILPLPEGLPDGWRVEQGFPGGLLPEAGTLSTPALGDMFSATDLSEVEFQPLEWVIEGWLPVGLTVLVGPPKSGKSWLCMDFATEIAAGRPVFGKIPTKQCAVLYLALEDPPRRLQSRMEKMLAGKPPSPKLIFATAWPRLDRGGLERLDQYLEQIPEIRLVIIDIWARVRGESNAKNKSVYNIDYADVQPIHALASRRNVALLLIHHTRKQDATDIFDSISGSQGISGAADSMMVLRRPRGEPTGQFAVTGRDIARDGTFAVRFDPETCKWTLLGEAREVKRESDKQRVYEVLFAATSPMSAQDIADESEINLNTVRQSLKRMKKRGAVDQEAHGSWGIAGREYGKKDD